MNKIITKITLSGLNCSACQKIVEKRLKNINGVEDVSVDLKSGEVQITGNKLVDNGEIIKVLEDTDYKII